MSRTTPFRRALLAGLAFFVFTVAATAKADRMSFANINIQATGMSELPTMLLVGTGLIGLASQLRKRRSKSPKK